MTETAEHNTDAGELPKEMRELVHKVANMEKIPVQELYGEAIEYLDYNFAYFLTHVLNIGKPRWHAGVPTAAVGITKDADHKEDFQFLFNPDFAQLFQLEEFAGEGVERHEAMAFVLAHETMHILLNHLRLCQSGRFQDRKRFNIAADCVINDYLVNMGLKSIKGMCIGDNIVGYNCANATVSQVYQDVEASCDECDGTGEVDNDSDGEGDQEGQGDGEQSEGDKKPCSKCQGTGDSQYPGTQIDDHGWMHDADEDQQNKAERATQGDNQLPQDLDRTKKDDDYQSSFDPGKGVGSKQAFAEDKNVGLKWAKLLEKVDPFLFKQGPREVADWSRRPRKLIAMPEGRVNLPIRKPHRDDTTYGKKPAIVMALDTSGSIGHEQANQFVNMARSIPQEKVKLHVCTFTTNFIELDLYADNPEWATGGTSWDPITRYIHEIVMPKNRKRYPSAVVVVTDGYASFQADRPDDKQGSAWYWLITSDGRPDYSDKLPGIVDELDNFQQGVKNG